MKKGFTLVELVIVIVIVGILSIIAVPVYRGYVERAKWSEAKALLGSVRESERIYYAEYGAMLLVANTDYNEALDIDARGNKYFKRFEVLQHMDIGFAANAYDDKGFKVVHDFALPGHQYTGLGGVKTPYFFVEKDGERVYI